MPAELSLLACIIGGDCCWCKPQAPPPSS